MKPSTLTSPGPALPARAGEQPSSVTILFDGWERRPPFTTRLDAMIRRGLDLYRVVERRELQRRAVLP